MKHELRTHMGRKGGRFDSDVVWECGKNQLLIIDAIWLLPVFCVFFPCCCFLAHFLFSPIRFYSNKDVC